MSATGTFRTSPYQQERSGLRGEPDFGLVLRAGASASKLSPIMAELASTSTSLLVALRMADVRKERKDGVECNEQLARDADCEHCGAA
jgi:hypothetical protein